MSALGSIVGALTGALAGGGVPSLLSLHALISMLSIIVKAKIRALRIRHRLGRSCKEEAFLDTCTYVSGTQVGGLITYFMLLVQLHGYFTN